MDEDTLEPTFGTRSGDTIVQSVLTQVPISATKYSATKYNETQKTEFTGHVHTIKQFIDSDFEESYGQDSDEFDCGADMCPICESDLSNAPCTGVIGAAQNEQGDKQDDIDHSFGNSKYAQKLQDTDKIQCVDSSGNLGRYDESGICNTDLAVNNEKRAKTEPLVINFGEEQVDRSYKHFTKFGEILVTNIIMVYQKKMFIWVTDQNQ